MKQSLHPADHALLCRGGGGGGPGGGSPTGSESRIFSASEGKPFENEIEAKQFDVMLFIKAQVIKNDDWGILVLIRLWKAPLALVLLTDTRMSVPTR